MVHPLYFILLNFMLGPLLTSAVINMISWITASDYWSTIDLWIIAVGVITGLLAAIVGTIDALAIPPGTRAKSVSVLHGSGNFLILVLFIASWFLRLSVPENPPFIANVLSFLGAAFLGITGWLGGELTLRLGIGVDEGANLNAPSSLSGLPANQNVPDSRDTYVSN